MTITTTECTDSKGLYEVQVNGQWIGDVRPSAFRSLDESVEALLSLPSVRKELGR